MLRKEAAESTPRRSPRVGGRADRAGGDQEVGGAAANRTPKEPITDRRTATIAMQLSATTAAVS